MLIDETHKKWRNFSLVFLLVATAFYCWYPMRPPQGRSGGSAVGIAFGIIGSAFMAFAGLLGARKKFPVWRLGPAQTWMRGHLWLGLLSLPLILFHGAFRFGGTLTTVLMVLLVIVIVSGVFGAVLQHYMPRMMTREVPLETIFEQIDSVRAQLLEEADKSVAAVCGPLGVMAVGSRKLPAGGYSERGGATPAAAAAATPALALTEEESAPLRSFYLRQMRPHLEKPGTGGHPLADPGKASGIFEELRKRVPPMVRETVEDLEDICEEERQLRRQARLHHWLHGWLLLHIPVSLALLVLGAVHAYKALRF